MFSRLSQLVLLLLIWSICFECSAQKNEKNNQIQNRIDAINLAAKHFQENVRFQCDFAYASGRSSSWEKAVSESNKLPTGTLHRMVKEGEDFHLSMGDYKGKHSKFSILATKGVEIAVSRETGEVSLSSPDNKKAEAFLSFYIDPISFSPFFMGGGKQGSLIVPLMPNSPADLEEKYRFEIAEDGGITVYQSVAARTGSELAKKTKWELKNKFQFKVLGGVPVLHQHLYEEFDDYGNLRLKSLLTIEDFVKCGDLFMGSNLKRVLGPFGTKKEFLHWRWHSANLKDNLAKKGDFEIRIPEGVSLQTKLKLPANRTIDRGLLEGWHSDSLDHFNETLRNRAKDSGLGISATKPKETSLNYFWLAGKIALAVVAILAFVFFVYRVRKTTVNPT